MLAVQRDLASSSTSPTADGSDAATPRPDAQSPAASLDTPAANARTFPLPLLLIVAFVCDGMHGCAQRVRRRRRRWSLCTRQPRPSSTSRSNN